LQLFIKYTEIVIDHSREWGLSGAVYSWGRQDGGGIAYVKVEFSWVWLVDRLWISH